MQFRLTARAALAALAALPATPGLAAQFLVRTIEPAAAGMLRVRLTIVNDGAGALAVPTTLPVSIAAPDATRAATLVRDGAGPSAVAPGGFVAADYLFRLPTALRDMRGATLRLADSAGPSYALAAPRATQSAAADIAPRPSAGASQPPAAPRPAAAPSAPAVPPLASAKPERANAYLGNLSAYAPIYAVYGPGTNTDGRLQLSFKYQLFGDPGAVGRGQPWENGIHFGYTQRMFWDLGHESSPFRTIDFMPELFYLVPATPVTPRLSLGGQAGLRHESNGRDGAASRSLNMIYVQPVATLPVGRTTVSVGPRAWAYVGSLDDNPAMRHYRGNTGLFLEVGQDDGFRLTTNSRLNFASGKGAVDAELSYPLDRIIRTPLNLYLFGQGFAGYGENLLDYNRHVTRLRFGIGVVR